MSTIHTVLPAPEGLEVQILKGHVGATPLPTLGCFECQTSCLGTCIWSGFLYETMCRTFTSLTNSFVTALVFAAPETVDQLFHRIHRHFLLENHLRHAQCRRITRLGYCTVAPVNTCYLCRWGRCLAAIAEQFGDDAAPPGPGRGHAVSRCYTGLDPGNSRCVCFSVGVTILAVGGIEVR